MKHPNFIMGLVSFILLLLGVIIKGNGYRSDNIIILSVILGFVHWIWSIIDVVKNNQLNAKSRPFWITVVIILPPLGGIIYYLMRSKNVVM